MLNSFISILLYLKLIFYSFLFILQNIIHNNNFFSYGHCFCLIHNNSLSFAVQKPIYYYILHMLNYFNIRQSLWFNTNNQFTLLTKLWYIYINLIFGNVNCSSILLSILFFYSFLYIFYIYNIYNIKYLYI